MNLKRTYRHTHKQDNRTTEQQDNCSGLFFLSITHLTTLQSDPREYTFIEQFWRLVPFETFNQSNYETFPHPPKETYRDHDKQKDKCKT